MPEKNPTACLLVIGNEVLSGRTRDANIQFLATGLGNLGIPLREVRIIPDVPETIIATVNEVRSEIRLCVHHRRDRPDPRRHHQRMRRRRVRRPWEPHPVAWPRMEASYKPGEFNSARQRMATMPRGAKLIENSISVAPGFQMENVYVMAGVPRVMQSMFEWLAPRLEGGAKIEMRAVHVVGSARGDHRRGAWRSTDSLSRSGHRQLPVLSGQRQRRGLGRKGTGRRCGGKSNRRGDGADNWVG